MDRSSGFGRVAPLGVLSRAFSAGGVATALAQELYGTCRTGRLASPPADAAPRPGCRAKARAMAEPRGEAPRPAA